MRPYRIAIFQKSWFCKKNENVEFQNLKFLFDTSFLDVCWDLTNVKQVVWTTNFLKTKLLWSKKFGNRVCSAIQNWFRRSSGNRLHWLQKFLKSSWVFACLAQRSALLALHSRKPGGNLILRDQTPSTKTTELPILRKRAEKVSPSSTKFWRLFTSLVRTEIFLPNWGAEPVLVVTGQATQRVSLEHTAVEPRTAKLRAVLTNVLGQQLVSWELTRRVYWSIKRPGNDSRCGLFCNHTRETFFFTRQGQTHLHVVTLCFQKTKNVSVEARKV